MLQQQSTNVTAKRSIEQVVDGVQYVGEVNIESVKLDYELTFSTPIPQLDDIDPETLRRDIRRIFQIVVKKEGQNIVLTDDEYGFFFKLLAEFAVDFYNQPQTRDLNRSVLNQLC